MQNKGKRAFDEDYPGIKSIEAECGFNNLNSDRLIDVNLSRIAGGWQIIYTTSGLTNYCRRF